MTPERKLINKVTYERIVDDISKIRVNPENHSQWDLDPRNRFYFDKCLDVHNDIDLYLNHRLGCINGLSGKYASFLNDVGITHQSDNGWWSMCAVDPKNIEAFITYYTDDPDESTIVNQYDSAANVYTKLKKAGFANHKYKLVTDAVEALNSIN